MGVFFHKLVVLIIDYATHQLSFLTVLPYLFLSIINFELQEYSLRNLVLALDYAVHPRILFSILYVYASYLTDAGFHFQFLGNINQRCIWILCNDIKSRWRRIWRSWGSPPRGPFCFYNSLSGTLPSLCFSFGLLRNTMHHLTEHFFMKASFCYEVQFIQDRSTGSDSWLPSLHDFSACLDSRIQLGTLLIGEEWFCIHELLGEVPTMNLVILDALLIYVASNWWHKFF